MLLDLTQPINGLLKFKTQLLLDKITEVSAPVESDEPFEITTTFLPRS
jgi:hypothetical protein